ncbi:MAG: hypothetical protein HQL40_11085 [Alphaproteobacteria bacterium]|nr:hypothetical protein [Alphaproteobacteria bacterium]
MQTIVAGALAAFVAIVFLGFMAWRIGEPALWVVIVAALVMMLADWIGAVRRKE